MEPLQLRHLIMFPVRLERRKQRKLGWNICWGRKGQRRPRAYIIAWCTCIKCDKCIFNYFIRPKYFHFPLDWNVVFSLVEHDTWLLYIFLCPTDKNSNLANMSDTWIHSVFWSSLLVYMSNKMWSSRIKTPLIRFVTASLRKYIWLINLIDGSAPPKLINSIYFRRQSVTKLISNNMHWQWI